jgi:transcriptional regulator of acetoin/glycerol metabolism
MPRCPLCGYSRPETADSEVPATHDLRTLADSVDSAPPQSGLAWCTPVGTTLQELEALLITATLQHTSGNVRAAAAILGIDRSTMYQKFKRYNIARP